MTRSSSLITPEEGVESQNTEPATPEVSQTPSAGHASPDKPVAEVTAIRADRGWQAIDLPELWRFRELFWMLALRNIKVRYKQTVLGFAWALIQPLAFTIVGSLLFAGSIDFAPAFLFFLASLLPWQMFDSSLSQASNSLVSAQGMIKKIYFPRLILPFGSAMVTFVDLLVQLAMITLIMLALPIAAWLLGGPPAEDDPAWRQNIVAHVPPIQVFLLPLAMIWSFMASMSVALWLAALNVQYRDIRYILPFITKFLIFAAPVFWSVQVIENDTLRAIYGLLPVAAPIEFFRWCLLGTPPTPLLWTVGLISSSAFLVLGLFYFRRMERTFADVV
ncbi:MAG: ABC transporter permease [Planctomycetota bacterium]